MFTKEKFLDYYQKVPVVELPSNTSQKPLVSVGVIAYQAEQYIRDCLEGILMQKTNFDFEILVGEDESSDKTREICIEYAQKFPDKIKLFLHSRKNNILTYGNPTGLFNYRNNLVNAKGKYWATCDGDDYWIDPLKLQKQVDFLEANEDYGLIYANKQIVCNDKLGREEALLLEKVKETDSLNRKNHVSGNIFWNLLENDLINTLTVCVRKELMLDYLDKFHTKEYILGSSLWLHAATFLKIKHVNEEWAAFRVHGMALSAIDGFIDKRLPLVKQAALFTYLSEIKNNPDLINEEILLETLEFIIKSKFITEEEKEPTYSFLEKNPKYKNQLN